MRFLCKRDAPLLLGGIAAVTCGAGALYLLKASLYGNHAPTEACLIIKETVIGPTSEAQVESSVPEHDQQAETDAADSEGPAEDDTASQNALRTNNELPEFTKPDTDIEAVVSCAQVPAAAKDATAVPAAAAAHEHVSNEAHSEEKHAVMFIEQTISDDVATKAQHVGQDLQLPLTVAQPIPVQQETGDQKQQLQTTPEHRVQSQCPHGRADKQEQLRGDTAVEQAPQFKPAVIEQSASEQAVDGQQEQQAQDELKLQTAHEHVANGVQRCQHGQEESPFATQQAQHCGQQLDKSAGGGQHDSEHPEQPKNLPAEEGSQQQSSSTSSVAKYGADEIQQADAVDEHYQAVVTQYPVGEQSQQAVSEPHVTSREEQPEAVRQQVGGHQPQAPVDQQLVGIQQRPAAELHQANAEQQQDQVQQPAEDTAASMIAAHPAQQHAILKQQKSHQVDDKQQQQQQMLQQKPGISAFAATQECPDSQQEITKRPEFQQSKQGALSALKVPPLPLQKLQQPREQQLKLTSSMPSERDRAIMYRLSIDKAAMNGTLNSSSSSSPRTSMELTENHTMQSDSDTAMAMSHSARTASGIITAFERSVSRQASQGMSTSPTSSASSPKVLGGVRMRQSFNTARNQPSIDDTVASAAVARSLAVQYPDNMKSAGSSAKQGMQCLSSWCAMLCKQHCKKLQEPSGEFGETTVLDIGCGTGGSCFELALSFSHVLGIDGDAMHVVAAKEMRDKGKLDYRPTTDSAGEQMSNGSRRDDSNGQMGDEQSKENQSAVQTARVSATCDRDKVRFWYYPLPELPPKLQPVDAILVEDVEGRLGLGLSQVCQQLPALLKPGGVCVVVLSGAASDDDSAVRRPGEQEHEAAGHGTGARSGGCKFNEHINFEQVKGWLTEHDLKFVTQQELKYRVATSDAHMVQSALAGVWLLPK